MRRIMTAWERPSRVGAVSKIIADAVWYRLRRLEMANLAGIASIAVAMRLPWPEVVHRAGFGLLINAIVYLHNDVVDVAADLRADNRHRHATRFLYDHRKAGHTALGVLAASAAIVGAWGGPGLLACGALGAGLGVVYSRWLKRKAGWDLVSMALWGGAMVSIGFPAHRGLGWLLAGHLALVSAVFEALQVVRDHDSDRGAGIRTAAVALGVERVRSVARVAMTLNALYCGLFLHPALAALALGALACPIRVAWADTDWRRIKAVYGVTWLAACGLLYVGRLSPLFGLPTAVVGAP